MSNVERFTIDRSKWLRGEVGELLREDGKMCCLGFFAIELGATEHDIADIGDPEVAPSCAPWPGWLLQDRQGDGFMHTGDAVFLIKTNDDMDLTDTVREERITRIFASHGVEVTFVDGDETL